MQSQTNPRYTLSASEFLPLVPKVVATQQLSQSKDSDAPAFCEISGLTVIGRTCAPQSSASGTSFATSPRPSTSSKTTPASGTAGRSQTKSTGGPRRSGDLRLHLRHPLAQAAGRDGPIE